MFVFLLIFLIDYEGLETPDHCYSVTAEYMRVLEKSKESFIPCIDKYMNSVLSSAFAHDIQSMQSLRKKFNKETPHMILLRAMQGFKKESSILIAI